MMQRMNRVIWIATAILMVSGCASHREQRGYARHPELKSGKSARGSGRQQNAPEPPRILPETNYAAGRIFEQQGSPEKAIEQYRKAIAVSHDYTAAYARLGLMLSITGQHEESTAAFTKAVELKPGSAVLRNNLGFELLYVERWEEAERHLREAARLDSRLVQAHINLGLLLGRTQRHEQAVESFRRVLPEPDAYYNLGLLHRAQGRYAQAAESFRHVLTLNPEFTAAQRQLVQVERKIAAIQTAATTVAANTVVVPANGTPDAKPTIDVADRPASPTTDSAPLVDLGSLIEEMFPASMTDETRPLAMQDIPKESEPKAVEIRQAPKSEAISIDMPADDTEIEPVRQAEYFNEDNAPCVEPSALAVPTPTTISPAAQPVRWDLTLADMARALNIADNQQRCLEELQMIAMQPGPVSSSQDAVQDSIVGPPAPLSDEVVLVLGASETQARLPESEPLDLTPSTSPEGLKSLKALDAMEVSLQIIRNEMQCQTEYGAGNAETVNPQGFKPEPPSEFTPTDLQNVDPNQRTQSWQSEFQSLDNLLAVVRNESICAQDSTLAQSRPVTQEHNGAFEQLAPPYYYGPALYAPPTTTPRRVR